jgi:hypothetical protein
VKASKARVVSIENGLVNVTYEGTLFEKNLEDINAEKREQARIEQERQANDLTGSANIRLMQFPFKFLLNYVLLNGNITEN